MDAEEINKKQLSGNIISPTEEDKKVEKVEYPKSCDMEINHSDLKLELMKFSKAIRNELNLGTILTLFSLWIVILNTNFDDKFGFSGEEISIIFIVVTIMLTLFVVKPIAIFFFRHITKFEWIKSKVNFLRKWHYDNEIDPEKKADNIIERCKRK